MRGARRLSSSLNQFAQHVQATADSPLTVNFVAHSHGGNVVLEALRHLRANVRVGKVALLGTPLVMARPAFRIARFVFLTIIFALIFLSVLLAPMLFYIGSQFILTGSVKAESFLEAGGTIESVLLFPLALIAYGWFFWLFGNLLDAVWRIFCRVFQPIAWIRGKARALLYGPSPGKLATILAGRPILLVTSHNDEADLLLQVGSAPGRLYREYVSTKFSIPGRVLEFAFLRPFTLGAFLKAIEMFLEVLSLGVPVWRALVQDFEIATCATGVYYPADLLKIEKLDVRPKAVTPSALVAETTGHSESIDGDTGLNSSLGLSLQEVTAELKRQIRLRHSAYYGDDSIIVHLAEFLTGSEKDGRSSLDGLLPKAPFHI